MPDLGPKKILVVDDEEEALNSLSNILRRAKYEVITTTKGKEALIMARTSSPDVILLDVLMPDMSGDDVAAGLLDDPQTAKIPVIFITALLEKQETSTGGKVGTHYVLGKPTTGKEVLDMVAKVLSESAA